MTDDRNAWANISNCDNCEELRVLHAVEGHRSRRNLRLCDQCDPQPYIWERWAEHQRQRETLSKIMIGSAILLVVMVTIIISLWHSAKG